MIPETVDFRILNFVHHNVLSGEILKFKSKVVRFVETHTFMNDTKKMNNLNKQDDIKTTKPDLAVVIINVETKTHS